MSENVKGVVPEKARQAANVAAIRMIEVAQWLNGLYEGPIDPVKIARSLDEIEKRIREAQQEIDRW